MNDDWLQRLARDAEPYLDDDGFTDAVMARLPAPRELGERTQLLILGGAASLGSAVAAFTVPWEPLLSFLVNSAQIPAIAATGAAVAFLAAGAFELSRRV